MSAEVPASQFFADIERPLLSGLKLLHPRFAKIHARWLELLDCAGISRDEAEPLFTLTPASQLRYLAEKNYDAYKLAVERHSHELVARGIPEGHALMSMALYLESCTACLPSDNKNVPKIASALARLTAISQQYVSAGYGAHRASGWRSLDEQERHRLSRDLHDEIGHSLVVLKLYLEMITMDLEKGNSAEISQKIQEAMTLVSQSIQSVRRLILDLGPAILEEVGFVPAVKLYARQFQMRTNIKVHLQEGPLPKMPANYETALYRVLQGALSNIVKHARASNVKINLGSVRDFVVVMIIEDDGVGFLPETKKSGQAFGLSAMRERIQALGGRFHIESAGSGSKRGTRIEVDLPVPRSVAA